MISRYLVCTLAFLLAVPAVADLNGTWTGSYTATSVLCQPAVPHGGSGSMTLSQSGTSISGTVFLSLHLADCRVTAPQPAALSFTGTASGDTFSGTVPNAPGGTTGTISGSLSNGELSFTLTAGDTTANGRAVRAGTVPANIAGSWQGGYNAVATACDPPEATSGLLRFDLSESGNSFAGTLTIQYHLVDCRPVSKSIDVPVAGSMDGITLTASFNAGPDLPPGDVTASLQGGALVVSFVAGDTTGTATLSRTPSIRRHAVKH